MASVTIEHFSIGHYDTFVRADYGGYASESKYWSSGPDEAHGWEIYLEYSISATKNVNYVVFEITTQNSVGDDVYCEISRQSKQRLKATGPFSSGKKKVGYWDNLCYYSGSLYLLFGNATLYYSDGTTETVSINLSDKRNHLEYFRHYQKEQGRAYISPGYKPKEYKESSMPPGLVFTLVICGIMILLFLTGGIK